MIKIGLCMQTMPKYVFRHSDFHKTQKCSLAACVHLPYWIQSKSIKKYGEYGSKLIYDRKKSVTTVARIITRFTLRQRVVRKPYSEINSNPIHGLWIIHFILWMIFLTLSSKVYNYYYSSSIGATTLGGFWPALRFRSTIFYIYTSLSSFSLSSSLDPLLLGQAISVLVFLLVLMSVVPIQLLFQQFLLCPFWLHVLPIVISVILYILQYFFS